MIITLEKKFQIHWMTFSEMLSGCCSVENHEHIASMCEDCQKIVACLNCSCCKKSS